MQKIIFTVAIAFCASQSFAQTGTEPIKVEIPQNSPIVIDSSQLFVNKLNLGVVTLPKGNLSCFQPKSSGLPTLEVKPSSVNPAFVYVDNRKADVAKQATSNMPVLVPVLIEAAKIKVAKPEVPAAGTPGNIPNATPLIKSE